MPLTAGFVECLRTSQRCHTSGACGTTARGQAPLCVCWTLSEHLCTRAGAWGGQRQGCVAHLLCCDVEGQVSDVQHPVHLGWQPSVLGLCRVHHLGPPFVAHRVLPSPSPPALVSSPCSGTAGTPVRCSIPMPLPPGAPVHPTRSLWHSHTHGKGLQPQTPDSQLTSQLRPLDPKGQRTFHHQRSMPPSAVLAQNQGRDSGSSDAGAGVRAPTAAVVSSGHTQRFPPLLFPGARQKQG